LSTPHRIERVLEEAEALFAEEGFLHFSTDELARRLRCSKRTLYSIAPTREKFFELTLERHFADTTQQMIQAAAAAPNCSAALCAFLGKALENLGDENAQFQKDLHAFPGARRAWKRGQKELYAALERIIAEGTKAGTFRRVEPALVANLLMAGTERICDPQFLSEASLSRSQSLRQMMGLFFEGLLSQSESRRLHQRGVHPARIAPSADTIGNGHTRIRRREPATSNGSLVAGRS
jgi:AcrR family transcriptional regulator